jgi:uncharacterized protein (TIGR02611 family)
VSTDTEPRPRSERSEKLQRRRERHLQRPRHYRVAFAIAAFVLVIAGFALIPLPGPGWALVFVGLGMLALEFDWAERLLHRMIAKAESAQRRAAAASPLQKALAGVAAALGIAACVVAAILWDIPLLPV